MKQRVFAMAAAFAAAASPLAGQAPADTFRRDQIAVTATKLASPLAAVPAHITVITGERLRQSGYTRVVDALRDQAGIAVAQLGAPGAVASLFLRGGESDYVQVLVDGVQVNDPGGAYDWAHLTTADIERIEIARGPASVLYGSDAVSGVIQVFTRRGGSRDRVEATVTAGVGERVGNGAEGSFGTWTGSAALSGGVPLAGNLEAAYSFSAARQESDGAYAFNNAYDNTSLAGRFQLAAGERTLAVTARYTDQQFHYPTDGAGNVLDHNRYTYGSSLAAGLALAQPLGPRVTAHLALDAYRNDTGAEDPEDEPDQGFSRSTGTVERDHIELRLDALAASTLTVSAGGELERQQGNSTYDSDGPFGPYTSETDDQRSSSALFAQLVRTGRLGVTAGTRLDHSDQFGAFGTARAGLSYQLSPALRVHTAWGTGFKEPTFLETYATGFARGNPDLQPEQSRSLELGVRAARRTAHLALTAFHQQFRNLIQYTFTPPAQDAPNYFNIGRARASGLELDARALLERGVEASATYTALHTTVSDHGFGEDRQFLEGEPLLRRPAHQLALGLSWFGARTTASLHADYTGERADLDFTDPAEWQGRRVTLPSHTTLDAALSWRPALHWGDVDASLRVRNLLGTSYQEVYNFPAAGRVITMGLRVAR